MRCLKVFLKKLLPTGNLVRTVKASTSSWHRGSLGKSSGSRSSEIPTCMSNCIDHTMQAGIDMIICFSSNCL